MRKMISWNVNGLRACVGKGFLEYVKESDADIFCIQESKLQEGQIQLDLPGYRQYWNYAEKKGYSGTAMFTKEDRSPFSTAWGSRSTIRRDGLSPQNLMITMWSPATRPTPRTA